MSYGIGIVVTEEHLKEKEIPYQFCEWVLPVAVKMYPELHKKAFKDEWHPEAIRNSDKLEKTSLEKLTTAPCDCVCVIDSEGNFRTLDTKPVDGNTNPLKLYLKL